MKNNINLKQVKKLQDKYLNFCVKNLLEDKEIHSFCKNAEKEINENYDELYKKGVTHIFGPGSIISDAAIKILNRLLI